MELDWIAPREYHEKSGRRVRNDKFRTEEEKKEQKKLNSAAWPAPKKPKAKVSNAALPTLERFVCSGSGQKRWRRRRQNSRAVEK